MLTLTTRLLRASLACAALAFAGCSDDDDPVAPVAPNPPLGVTATATSSSSIRVSFSTAAGINSYNIERAAGATGGTFAQIGTVPAPTTPGTVTYDDTGLAVQSPFRYRVIAVQGSLSSAPSGEASATTLPFGSFTANITGDIAASRTLYADTTYTLKAFVHVGNAATLTIQPGTTIKGDEQSALFIMRGAKINAVGTAAARSS
jgi:hypothetical protein